MFALLLWVLPAACGTGGPTDPEGIPGATDLCQADRPIAYELTSACRVEAENPGRIVLTTEDGATGGVSVVELATRTVSADVAHSEIDSLPYYHDGTLFILHRLGFDRVDILDPSSGYSLLGQHPVLATGSGAANAQALAVGPDGAAFVSNMGVPELHVYDFGNSPGDSLVETIDLSRFADADGNPEQGLMVNCGSTVFVSVQRLAPDFSRTGVQSLVPIDTASCEAYDSAIPYQGWFVRGVRKDPSDTTGHSVVLLTTGVERVNLATGDVSWIVSDSDLQAAGIGGYQPQSFDFHGTERIYLAAYRSDYSAVDVWRFDLESQTHEAVITGLNAKEKTLEIIGDELWFGDTTAGQEGLRVYDLAQDPPALVAGPLDVGLPPKSMLAIP
jgi:hypothetical protein